MALVRLYRIQYNLVKDCFVYDMPRLPDASNVEFWEHVRAALRSYLAAPRSAHDGTHTQAQLAKALGLKPGTLANFLSQKKTNKSIGGLALAKACALGIEFECDHQRIGRLRLTAGELAQRPPAEHRQLLLEFSPEFELVQVTPLLSLRIRKDPESVTADPGIRLRLG